MVDVQSTNLQSLTEGIHSKEALELVREHLNAVTGPTAGQFSNVMLKMSKFQMAQVGGWAGKWGGVFFILFIKIQKS